MKKKIIIGAVASAVLVAIALTLWLALGKKVEPKAENESSETTETTAEETKPELSAEDVEARMAELGENEGYANALSEMKTIHTTEIDRITYFRMQQYYQGIPVYGRTVVYAVDNEENALSITGNAIDIDESILIKPTVSQEIIEENVHSYFASMGHEGVTRIAISELADENLLIYADGPQSCLVYSNTASIFTAEGDSLAFRILSDAQTGEVLKCICMTYTDIYDTAHTSSRGLALSVDKIAESTYMRGAVTVYNGNGRLLQSGLKTQTGEIAVDFDGNVLLDATYDEVHYYFPDSYTIEEDTEIATYLTNNIKAIYAYYRDVLGQDGIGKHKEILLLYNVKLGSFLDWMINENVHDNAACDGHAFASRQILLYFGKDNSMELDTIAHEYTHAVERNISNMEYAGESGSIMEALSDIYGELIEAWCNDATPNWSHGDLRNIKNPETQQRPSYYGGSNWADPLDMSYDLGGVHNNSTVISHAAYLMWNGGEDGKGAKLTTDELAKLWYHAILMMPWIAISMNAGHW